MRWWILVFPRWWKNYAPHGLKALSGLEVEENQTLGTVVGQFIASDPEGSSFAVLDDPGRGMDPWMVESRMTELEALSNDLTKSLEDLENYSMEMAELEIKLARLESQDLFNLDSSGILRTEVVCDFENNASNYQVWVKVVDDQGASQEKEFSILLIDQNESVEPEDPTDPTDPTD